MAITVHDKAARPPLAAACRRFAAEREQWARFRARPQRTPQEVEKVTRLLERGRAERDELLREQAVEIYARLTDDLRRSVRARELVYAAAEAYPGLLPTEAEIRQERRHAQSDKDGLELEQGLFLAHVLDNPDTGHHLMHSMSQPTARALALRDRLRREDRVDLGLAAVHREGNVGYVYTQNHRFLNAEDDASTAALETAVDLVLLDDRIEVGVLRGAPATHPKWAGRRVFGAGINLTHLYQGQISLVDFFVERELGVVNKMYRGHPAGSFDPRRVEERHEKPWIAAVDAFAIGGGLQFLLVMDRVVAEEGVYLNLPAAKEGLIPGCGNLRLPRFVGERLARQIIFFGRTLAADSDQGRLLVDEVVPVEQLPEAVRRSAAELLAAGTASLHTGRRASRLDAEPLDRFRRYMARYTLDQAYNIYDPALIDNLERTWKRARR